VIVWLLIRRSALVNLAATSTGIATAIALIFAGISMVLLLLLLLLQVCPGQPGPH
jgi:hypothetical protein